MLDLAAAEKHRDRAELWLVTGLAGAGKSLALKCLEDLGCWCVDNLPAGLMKPFTELESPPTEQGSSWRALGLRGIDQLKELDEALSGETATQFNVRLLFLECEEATLVKRYSESRRLHPLVNTGLGLLKALREERAALASLKGKADFVIDTTHLSPHTLLKRLEGIKTSVTGRGHPLFVHLQSFGFKHGIPADSEWMWDLRHLPNPYYDLELRSRSGLEPEVSEVVFSDPVCTGFVEQQITGFLALLPIYSDQGRRQVNLGIGCTGGQHRSVATVERLAQRCHREGYTVSVHHRDAKLKPEFEERRSVLVLPSEETLVYK